MGEKDNSKVSGQTEVSATSAKLLSDETCMKTLDAQKTAILNKPVPDRLRILVERVRSMDPDRRQVRVLLRGG